MEDMTIRQIREHLENGGEFRYEQGDAQYFVTSGRFAYLVEGGDPRGHTTSEAANTMGHLLLIMERNGGFASWETLEEDETAPATT